MYRTSSLFLAITFVLASCLAGSAAAPPDVPAGTDVHVRIIDTLTSAKAKVGDIFHGTLEEPIVVGGKQLFPKGADVTGTVVAVHESGRVTDPGELSLVLNTISSGKTASSVTVQPLLIKGESHAKSNVTKIGGGAALGAIIGGIAGGGKGAAIGAGVGGAAGTAGAAATGKREAVVESEAILKFVTTETSSAVPLAQTNTTPEAPPLEKTPSAKEPEREQQRAGDTFGNAVLFTARDRRVIRNCLNAHASEFPEGTLERPELPSGSDRQVRVGGTLPNDVETRAQALPLACEEQLPHLPTNQERVVYSGRVLLVDDNGHVLDMFELNENR
ncbi:MAG TPA: hypothetical protein VEV41_13695 [Terriglobales bacterium]|nr:hypothetical protein [Terriglobales bacterium]